MDPQEKIPLRPYTVIKPSGTSEIIRPVLRNAQPRQSRYPQRRKGCGCGRRKK
ncbi:hypothetical protein C8P63_109103 [Melghirimyces profundicolus]|uniref:Uncharacterized protein n=1 Tax=Melghirimyces profundicolus TaxID=1242148 RepID=A0A2T6BW85_9BACL|nr:hypothetical protein C8P63_109103 [Melghirimyces profundicolus]